MEEKETADTIRMLIERMQDHPEEFVHPSWNPVQYGVWEVEPFMEVRWGSIMRAVMSTGHDVLFTAEEVALIKEHYRKLLRNQMDECIIKELVGNELVKEMDFRHRQMELPYTTMTTNIERQREKELQRLSESYQKYEANKNKGMLG